MLNKQPDRYFNNLFFCSEIRERISKNVTSKRWSAIFCNLSLYVNLLQFFLISKRNSIKMHFYFFATLAPTAFSIYVVFI